MLALKRIDISKWMNSTYLNWMANKFFLHHHHRWRCRHSVELFSKRFVCVYVCVCRHLNMQCIQKIYVELRHHRRDTIIQNSSPQRFPYKCVENTPNHTERRATRKWENGRKCIEIKQAHILYGLADANNKFNILWSFKTKSIIFQEKTQQANSNSK